MTYYYNFPGFNCNLLNECKIKQYVDLMQKKYISYWNHTLQHSQKRNLMESLEWHQFLLVPIVPLVTMDHRFDESYPFVYIGPVCINTASWKVMISASFTIFRSLNKGLECSMKLEKMIILIAFFCKLDKGCKVDWYALPQAITQ